MVSGSQDVREGAAGAGARRLGRALAAAAAVLAAVLVWLVARTVFDQDLVVRQPGREATEVDIGPVLVFAVVPSLAGWALLAVLERFAAARARVVWTVVAVAVLLLSFVPILQVEATGATKAALALMHVVVGAALIPGFWRTARGPR
ncbi:hypothetical protein Acsp03_10300 [Actinomadura sp. NBRC 104412]|nr:hypothetical protein Acsp03_10300 [Actinomadura sp. NBRC 104412]